MNEPRIIQYARDLGYVVEDGALNDDDSMNADRHYMSWTIFDPEPYGPHFAVSTRWSPDGEMTEFEFDPTQSDGRTIRTERTARRMLRVQIEEHHEYLARRNADA